MSSAAALQATQGFSYPVHQAKGTAWRNTFWHCHPHAWFFRVYDLEEFDHGRLKVKEEHADFETYKVVLPSDIAAQAPQYHRIKTSIPLLTSSKGTLIRSDELEKLVKLLRDIEPRWRENVADANENLVVYLKGCSSERDQLKSSEFWHAWLKSLGFWEGLQQRVKQGRKFEVLAMLAYVQLQYWKNPGRNNYDPILWDEPKDPQKQSFVKEKGRSFSPSGFAHPTE
ncbi:MAG: hypothetical protein Q9159_001101 [Coniocarpon cinnabarinum]